jgi:hypothetical protein
MVGGMMGIIFPLCNGMDIRKSRKVLRISWLHLPPPSKPVLVFTRREVKNTPPLLCVCTNKPTHFETGGRPANPLSTCARLLVTLPACFHATPTTAEGQGYEGGAFFLYVTAWLVKFTQSVMDYPGFILFCKPIIVSASLNQYFTLDRSWHPTQFVDSVNGPYTY